MATAGSAVRQAEPVVMVPAVVSGKEYKYQDANLVPVKMQANSLFDANGISYTASDMVVYYQLKNHLNYCIYK
jgi:hypothetical protein